MHEHIFVTLRDQMPPIATTELPNKIFQPIIIDIDASLNISLQDLDLKIMSATKLMFPIIM